MIFSFVRDWSREVRTTGLSIDQTPTLVSVSFSPPDQIQHHALSNLVLKCQDYGIEKRYLCLSVCLGVWSFSPLVLPIVAVVVLRPHATTPRAPSNP